MSLFWPTRFWTAGENAESPFGNDEEPSPGQHTAGRRSRERRRARRYPLKLPLRYRITEARGGQSGGGETVDISSKALLFTGDAQPPTGVTIEVVMRWPVQVGEETPLRLLVAGPVLRRDERGAVVLIKRFEFFQQPADANSESGRPEQTRGAGNSQSQGAR
jgi:hypothetical protein